ncbi:MAG TPA: hypothetical protein DCL18_08730 [Prevotella sp.]|nr:hypothetical protein [Prevotella sp.]
MYLSTTAGVMATGAAGLSMLMEATYKLGAGREIEKSGLAMIMASPEIVVSNHEMINKDIARELAAMGGRYT